MMEGRRDCYFHLVTMFCLVLRSWVHIDPAMGYSLKNCTVRGSLNDSQHLKVLCFKMKYRTVPSDIPHNAAILDISMNNISQIRTNDFRLLRNLKFLNVSRNWLSIVEEGAFRDLVSLEDLNLANNRLTTITESTFQGLVNLTWLRLDYNRISRIESTAFLLLSNLRVVNVTRNQLQHIKYVQPILKLPYLQELYVAINELSTFQSQDLPDTSLPLKILDLSRNPLKIFNITREATLPYLEFLDISYSVSNESMVWNVQDNSLMNSVNKLYLSGLNPRQVDFVAILQSFNTSLKYLRLCEMKGMKIATLVKDACRAPLLRVLRLKSNNLTSLDDPTFQPCPQIIQLDLSVNSIFYLSNSIFRPIQQLRILRLTYNRLEFVPNATQNLPALESLDLSFNRIAKLNCFDFANLTQLKSLYLYRNHISVLKPCLFQDLRSLQILKMGNNKILTITNIFRKGPHQLEHLELRANKLSSIRSNDFQSLRSLKYLDVVDNQISKIEKGAFNGLFNLTELYMGSNKITEEILSSTIFSGIPNLKLLYLNSNALSYKNHNKLELPPFSHLKSLAFLSINSQKGKGLLSFPSNLLEGLTSLKSIFAGNLHINFLHPETFKYTPSLSFLDISKNVLDNLSSEVFQALPALDTLVLSKARLRSLDFLIRANLTRLQSLQVRQNTLAVINETVINSLPSLSHLNMEENAFTCDCSNAWFIDWVVTNIHTQVIYASRFVCKNPTDLRGTMLLDLNIASCTVDIGIFYFIFTTTVILITLLTSFFYQFLRWQVVYAYFLFLAYLHDYKQKRKGKAQRFQYDAFISYNTNDELWVMRELLPQLEDEQGWKLCLHHRDFQPGRPIMDNIVDGIYGSRKTICLISRHYLESEWCSREIQVASFRLFDQKEDVLILVFLEDIPACHLSPYHQMRKLVKKNTYLRRPKPGEDAAVFWHKLKVALTIKEEPQKKIPIMLGVEHEG